MRISPTFPANHRYDDPLGLIPQLCAVLRRLECGRRQLERQQRCVRLVQCKCLVGGWTERSVGGLERPARHAGTIERFDDVRFLARAALRIERSALTEA